MTVSLLLYYVLAAVNKRLNILMVLTILSAASYSTFIFYIPLLCMYLRFDFCSIL